jgi:hypothetical protein
MSQTSCKLSNQITTNQPPIRLGNAGKGGSVGLSPTIVTRSGRSCTPATNTFSILTSIYYGFPLTTVRAHRCGRTSCRRVSGTLAKFPSSAYFRACFCQPHVITGFMHGKTRCVEIVAHFCSSFNGKGATLKSSIKRLLIR